MSAPLDIYAIADTQKRIEHDRRMHEYRRLAREELDRSTLFQKDHPSPSPAHLAPTKTAAGASRRLEVHIHTEVVTSVDDVPTLHPPSMLHPSISHSTLRPSTSRPALRPATSSSALRPSTSHSTLQPSTSHVQGHSPTPTEKPLPPPPLPPKTPRKTSDRFKKLLGLKKKVRTPTFIPFLVTNTLTSHPALHPRRLLRHPPRHVHRASRASPSRTASSTYRRSEKWRTAPGRGCLGLVYAECEWVAAGAGRCTSCG